MKDNHDNVFIENIKITDDILEQLCVSKDVIDDEFEYNKNHLEDIDEAEEMYDEIIPLENTHQCSIFYCEEGCFKIQQEKNYLCNKYT